jgi:hypothetical protein
MITDGTEFNRRYRPLIYKGGATLGLWIVVASGFYLGHMAESAKLDRLSSTGSTKTAAVDAIEVKARNKDDGYTFVSAPAAGRIAALPIARPARSDDAARQSSRQNNAVGAAAPRNEPLEFAGTERFDRCMPACESRDPLVVHAAPTQAVYRTLATSSSASDVPTDEHPILLVGRQVVSQIADAPRTVLDTGKETLETLVQLVQ